MLQLHQAYYTTKHTFKGTKMYNPYGFDEEDENTKNCGYMPAPKIGHVPTHLELFLSVLVVASLLYVIF